VIGQGFEDIEYAAVDAEVADHGALFVGPIFRRHRRYAGSFHSHVGFLSEQ
jgi:hypothetical protein